jgi:hypothetical protein
MTGGLLFSFGDVAAEIAKRLHAEHIDTRQHIDAFVSAHRAFADAPGWRSAFDVLSSMADPQSPLSGFSPHYKRHAIRVAAIYLRVRGNAARSQDLSLALLHNLIEVGGDAAIDMLHHFDASEVDRIKTLTIDRARERDPAYLNGYYDRLLDTGLLLFKCCDKLDNHLTYVKLDLDRHHYSVVEDYLCPRLTAVSPDMANYLLQVTAVSQNADERAKYAALYPTWKESH